MSAIFSRCLRYRYSLTRSLSNDSDLRILWVMLNPSTADGTHDDPTIRRCIDYSTRWGFGIMEVGNLYALRATDPSMLSKNADPIGPMNDRFLRDMATKSDLILCAWGTKVPHYHHRTRTLYLLRKFGALHCLKITKAGHPAHPLYLPKELEPIAY